MNAPFQQPGPLRTAAILLVVLVLSGVGLLDYVTGPWVSFALLYVLPVLAASWFLGRGAALTAALAASAAWFVAEARGLTGEPPRALWWNALSRLAMLMAMAAMVVRIREDRRRLQEANLRLSGLLSGAEKMARTDPLTGLPNRRAFLERLSEEIVRARRSKSPVCVAYLDVDNFKDLNDRQGHVEGDEFLKTIAQALRETVRASDVAARLGGDEFAVLFVDPKRTSVEALAQRLLARVRTLAERHPGLDLGASVGIAFYDQPPQSAEQILQHADAAMYEAKAGGKRRFALWADDAGKPGIEA